MGFFEIVDKVWEALGSIAPNQWMSTIFLLCLGTLVVTFLIILLPPFIVFLKLLGTAAEDLVKTIGKVLIAVFVVGVIYLIIQIWRNPVPVAPPTVIPAEAIEEPISIENTPENIMPDNIIVPTLSLQSQQTSNGICWAYQLQNFSGTRWQVWERIVKNKVGNMMEWSQFKVDVITYNPALVADDYEFFNDKTYLLPERCP